MSTGACACGRHGPPFSSFTAAAGATATRAMSLRSPVSWRAGFVAFGVGCMLAAPERPGYPRQLREMRAAVRFIRRNAWRFRADPARVGALGISAGAHLVALAGTTGRRCGSCPATSTRRSSRRRCLSRQSASCVECARRDRRPSPSGLAGPLAQAVSALDENERRATREGSRRTGAVSQRGRLLHRADTLLGLLAR